MEEQLLDLIEKNTKPLFLVDLNLSWWSFSIAVIAAIISGFALIYSRKGYLAQKKANEKLDKLVPGQMSYYRIISGLINNIIDIESIFFGQKNYVTYPYSLVLLSAKLPEDLIDVQKYEKNPRCYEAAVDIKLSWRNYNLLLDKLINNSDSKNKLDVSIMANNLLDMSKAELLLIQNFETILSEEGYIIQKTASVEHVARYILDLFFEIIQLLKMLEIKKIDISRTNLNKETARWYTDSTYLPYIIDEFEYMNMTHHNRLSGFGKLFSNYTDCDINQVMNSLRAGDYNFISSYFEANSNIVFSEISFEDFYQTYYKYIEPIIVGYRRYELSKLKS